MLIKFYVITLIVLIAESSPHGLLQIQVAFSLKHINYTDRPIIPSTFTVKLMNNTLNLWKKVDRLMLILMPTCQPCVSPRMCVFVCASLRLSDATVLAGCKETILEKVSKRVIGYSVEQLNFQLNALFVFICWRLSLPISPLPA